MAATHITKTVAWNEVSPTDFKYKLTLDAYFDIVNVSGNYVTINITGNYTVAQTEHQQQLVAYPASDFGFLFFGNVIPAAPTTVIPGDFYQAALPTLFGGSAEQYQNKLMLEFRGDTYASDGGNFTTVWTRKDGVVWNRKFGNTSTVIPINETITMVADQGGLTPVLSWSTTYVTFNPTTYHWGDSEAWITIADLDYRPGGIYVSGSGWLSHNRSGGADDIYDGSSWNTMRTAGAPSAKGNPPEIYHNGDWYNMRKIDQE